MEEYIVDLSGITDRDSLHRRLQKSLPLPDWYGGNLDALYDALTELPCPVRIRFSGGETFGEADPVYMESLRRVLREAQDDTPGLEVLFSKKMAGPAGSGRTLIITDLHGCLDECRNLLAKMGFDEDADTLISLGDTIDRGPQIYETFEFLHGLKERIENRCILIRGNHEQMMLDAAAMGGRDKELWYYNKGEKTVFSFLHHRHRYQEFLSWYEDMPLYYETEKYSCVHASLLDPDPARNESETLLWGRDTEYSGKLVMTGHTPYRAPVYFHGEGYGRLQEDIWTVLPETGMIALDTGCVYGNRLTGMVIRSDGNFLVTSVPAVVRE